MTDNFEACLIVTLAYEGGLSLLSTDPGNWTGGKVGRGDLKGTNFGIAASAHPSLDIRGLTKDSAGIIYRQNYWVPSGADAQPPGLDLSLFDASVNSGVAQARRWLIRARGRRQHPDETTQIIHAYAAARLSFLHALKSWKAFGKGWGVRVAGVEAKSLRMALGPSQKASEGIRVKAIQVQRQSNIAAVRAKASGVTVIACPMGAHVTAGGHHVIAFIIGGAAVLGGAILAFAAWRHTQRAAALTFESLKTSQPETKGLRDAVIRIFRIWDGGMGRALSCCNKPQA